MPPYVYDFVCRFPGNLFVIIGSLVAELIPVRDVGEKGDRTRRQSALTCCVPNSSITSLIIIIITANTVRSVGLLWLFSLTQQWHSSKEKQPAKRRNSICL